MILLVAAQSNSPWKILCTCQTEDLQDVLKRLYRNNVTLANPGEIELNLLGDDEVTQIAEAFPELVDLLKHDHLTPVLANLKYLDLMAYHSQRLTEIKNLGKSLCETDIIDWIWEAELEGTNATQASRFLQKMAEIQAQTLKATIPVSDFNVEELTPVNDLKNRKLIRDNQDQLSFIHDLFGDWATYKLIRGKQGNIKAFLIEKDLLSPLWCKGVRLYGVHLLSSDPTGKRWTEAFDSFSEHSPIEKIIQDLLLESILFSSHQETNIDALWEKLKEDNGKLLNRFLQIFLHRATAPNARIINFAREKGLGLSLAATVDREIKYLYWGPVIRSLHKHQSDALQLSRLQVAKIVNEWLRKTPVNFPFRQECAELATQNALWVIETKRNGTFVGSDITGTLYEPLLAAINEKTEQVKSLLLSLCKRDTPVQTSNENPLQQVRPKSQPEEYKVRSAKHWQHGPYERVDDGLTEICLNGDALYPVIRHSPRLASEILLALLIDPPKAIYFGYDHHYHFDLNEPRHWHPPFYTRGPFLNFLRLQPTEGLQTIIALLNFMTDRWSQHLNEAVPEIQMSVQGISKRFIGDQPVYFWFRDIGAAPHTVVSALMALEKYLMEQIDSNKDISPLIAEILSTGNSVAFLGLLISVGKYKPTLFLQELNPLLSVLEFYVWERMQGYSVLGGHQLIGIFDELLLSLAKEWNELPHRRQPVEQTGLALIFSYPVIKTQYETFVSGWKARTDLPEFLDAYTENLFHYFDPKNFSVQQQNDKVLFIYNEPEEITEKYQDVRQDLHEQSQIDLFAFRCYNDLKNKKNFTSEDIEGVWRNVQSFSSYSEEHLYSFMHPKLNSMFGGILIILQNQDLWTQNSAERKDWIVGFVDKTIVNWEPDENEISMHSVDYHWPQFCAGVLPILWKDNFQDRQIRKLVADFVLKAAHDALTRLFGSTARYLKWSDKEFIQLQNLVIERATSDQSDEISKHNELKKAFSESEISIVLQDWSSKGTPTQVVEEDFLPSARFQRQYVYSDPTVDDEMIAHAYSEFPLEILQTDKQEYDFSKTLWGFVVNHLKNKIGEPTNDQRLSYHMNSFDTWAIKRIAYLTVELNDGDKPEEFWSPILEHGVPVHQFIESFMEYFFYFNLNRKEKYEKFFNQWEKMLGMAYLSPNWKRSRLNAHEYDSVWASIIGFSNAELGYWNGDFKDFVTRANPQLKKWALKNIFNQHAIQRILLFIRSKSGETFIKDGILFTSFHLKSQEDLAKEPVPNGYIRVGFEHNGTLAATIGYLWENHKQLLRGDAKLFDAFKGLVTYLVSIQNPIGLDVQERIIES